MKEVTRIRIAKNSYDIEISAKKQLEAYLQSLTVYAEDENILEDIEIRITELLADRGVSSDDVISVDDVAAVREILGEPKNFIGEGDIAVGDDIEISPDGTVKRKLYRDIDHAVLGGVLGGIAQYFKINALWTRLIFLFLLLISFGTAALVYVVCWIIIPAAVSMTEKLQARGEAATLAAIRRQGESDEGTVSTQDRIRTRKRIVGILVGLVGITSALGGIGLTIASVVALNVGVEHESVVVNPGIWTSFITAGGLFVAFSLLVAVAGFRGNATKQMIIAGILMIIVGVGSFAAGLTMMGHQAWQRQEEIQRSIKDRALVLPETFSQTKQLVLDAPGLSVEYHVSTESRAVLTAVPDIEVKIRTDGESTRVFIEKDPKQWYPAQPALAIYGPALTNVTAESGFVNYYGNDADTVTVRATNGEVSLFGSYQTATLYAVTAGRINAEGANVESAVTELRDSGVIALGNIAHLTATQPTTCATDATAQLTIEGIADRQITYNGVAQPAASRDESCVEVRFGDEDQDQDYSRYSS